MKVQQDRFPRKSKVADEDYKQYKKLSGKTDKEANERNDKKTDFLGNPNWLKKIIGNTRHCLERLIIMIMNKIPTRQISPEIQIDKKLS